MKQGERRGEDEFAEGDGQSPLANLTYSRQSWRARSGEALG